jgi:hypothetical protein
MWLWLNFGVYEHGTLEIVSKECIQQLTLHPSQQVQGIFTLFLGTTTTAYTTYKFSFTLRNSPIGQYAPQVSISAVKTSLMLAQYEGQQLYPTYDQWGALIPPITAALYGTSLTGQAVTTGMGYKSVMLINGFLPSFRGFSNSLNFMFQSNPSSYNVNMFNLSFGVYSHIENSSALTLSGMSGVMQPDGPVAVGLVLCYLSNNSQICHAYTNATFISDAYGNVGQATWQGALSSLIFYVSQSIRPSVLISLSFSLLNPR